MEYGLGAFDEASKMSVKQLVLILVLMEYGLGDYTSRHNGVLPSCLNPCFNGIWSRSHQAQGEITRVLVAVLILVLMEYGLGDTVISINAVLTLCVLILVLMEYGLGGLFCMENTGHYGRRLNPCFNGIWSRRKYGRSFKKSIKLS